MRISAPGSFRPAGRSVSPAPTFQSRGFTLIEALLVVLIAGVMAALIMPGFSASRVSAKDEAERIAALMEHAQTLASLRGVALAWRLDADGYGFLDWQDRWQPTQQDIALRYRKLPHGVSVQRLAAQPVSSPLPASAASDDMPPDLIFPPVGFPPPFGLRVVSSEGAWTVVGNLAGRIAIAAETPAP
ncbi:MAG TPA: GspH/FimT family pseudopilin [Rhodocyclaceae bacterium]|nr:GspH/FimT family pseudopilin [Rhodocyclaceae bacterium]